MGSLDHPFDQAEAQPLSRVRLEHYDGQLSEAGATVLGVIRRTDREQAILTEFRERAASLIGEFDGFGIVGEDNTFRGPAPSSYVMSTLVEDDGIVVLRIQRKDLPWRREIHIVPKDSWKESTNGGPVEHSSAHFPSEQQAILNRLFGDISRST